MSPEFHLIAAALLLLGCLIVGLIALVTDP